MLMLCGILLILLPVRPSAILLSPEPQNSNSLEDYLHQLSKLTMDILHRTTVNRCYAIITDNLHQHVFNEQFFLRSLQHTLTTYFTAKVYDDEDLLSPSEDTVRVLEAIKDNNCDLNFIYILNGIQMKRFLIFMEENRFLNTNSRFVLFFDYRIFTRDMLHIWKKIVNVVILKRIEGRLKGTKHIGTTRFQLLTIPYPNILNGSFVTKRLSQWRFGKFRGYKQFFPEKISNLNGYPLRTVAVEHMPMVLKRHGRLEGIEVEILKSLGKAMNFTPDIYETEDAGTQLWGREIENDTYSGLLGEMMQHNAYVAIGDLHHSELYTKFLDLSIPHYTECFTFLTPESSEDNSWKTLIVPFSGIMWVAVICSLFILSVVFYTFSYLHSFVSEVTTPRMFFGLFRKKYVINEEILKDYQFRRFLNKRILDYPKRDIFDRFSNCALLPYSMLLYVSLPKMPLNWPLRLLTGWYWIYCILLGVTYKASFTAILANPAPRLTYDNIEELSSSRITYGAWGNDNLKFFRESADESARLIGGKMVDVNNIYEVTIKISEGSFAYYDNEFFLRYLRSLGVKNHTQTSDTLHIMKECVIYQPISLGLEKNSPLRLNFNKYIARLIEGGLIAKWLNDFTENLPYEEEAPKEAFIDLRKFWSSFVVLATGYFLAGVALLFELWHFKNIVQSHFLYDKYNTKAYYNYKKLEELQNVTRIKELKS